MKPAAAGGAAVASVPVVWDFLGYHFQAGPLIVTVCATLMTRLIISLKSNGRRNWRHWTLDVAITGLCALIAALWVQANSLAPLPAGISGIAFGAIGVGIISMAKSQMGAAFRAAVQTFFRTAAALPPHRDDSAQPD